MSNFEEEDDDLIGGDIPASGRTVTKNHNSDTVAGEKLRSFIIRIERLEEDKQALMEDIKDVYIEVKGSGFDVKVVKAVIKRRKQDKQEIDEFEDLLGLYLSALGMV